MAKLAPLLKKLKSSGVNLADLAPLLKSGGLSNLLGGGASAQKGDSEMAEMMVIAAMIGAQLASGTKPDKPKPSSDDESSEQPGNYS